MSSDRGAGPQDRQDGWHRDSEQAISLASQASPATRPDLPTVQGEQFSPSSAEWRPLSASQQQPAKDVTPAQPVQTPQPGYQDAAGNAGSPPAMGRESTGHRIPDQQGRTSDESGAEPQPVGTPQGSGAIESASPGGDVVFVRPPEYRKPHPMGGKARRLPKLFQAVPDTALDGADFEGLTVRAASLRGDDHRYMTEPRQDTAALWPLTLGSTDALLCCVADGVGSQPNSHMGSHLACWLLRNEFERGADAGLWDDPRAFGSDIIGRIASGMLTDAEARRIHPETLSTTLVAALVELTPPDIPRRAVVLRVGDSTAFMLRDGVFQECFLDAHKGEDVQESGTPALPGNPGTVEVGTVMLGNDDVLVLCTDGLSKPMHNDEVREQLVKWWSTGPVPGILEFGWQLGFRAKSYGDDRSAVCVWGR